MASSVRVIGWKLDRGQRAELLERFPPRYPDPDADHVTLCVSEERRPLPGPVDAKIVGHADDSRGLECLVVAIDGSTDRPDGSTFHITWSLDKGKGRKPRESNDLLREQGWDPLDDAIPVGLEPARLR